MAKQARLLCVDDEVAVLEALKRVFRGESYKVDTATSALEGLDLIAQHDYDIIISDMRMPKMDGAEFLRAASIFVPDTERILLTGFSEHTATERAINNGKINGFISKPWDNTELLQVVGQSLRNKQYQDKDRQIGEQLVHSNRVLFDRGERLKKAVSIAHNDLSQTLSLLHQSISLMECLQDDLSVPFRAALNLFSSSINRRLGCQHQSYEAISDLAGLLGEELGLSKLRCRELRLAGRLFVLGKLDFSDELLAKSPPQMTAEEQVQYRNYPAHGADILTVLDKMQGVADIIRDHGEDYSGCGHPRGLKATAIPLPARILSAAIEFQRLSEVADSTPEQLATNLRALSRSRLDPLLVELMLGMNWENVNAPQLAGVQVPARDLRRYMEISRNVYDGHGQLVLAQGTTITAAHHKRLLDIERAQSIELDIYIDSNSYLGPQTPRHSHAETGLTDSAPGAR